MLPLAAAGIGLAANEFAGGHHRLAEQVDLRGRRWVVAPQEVGVTSTNLKAGEGTGSATAVSGAAHTLFRKSLLRKRKRLASSGYGGCAGLTRSLASHKVRECVRSVATVLAPLVKARWPIVLVLVRRAYRSLAASLPPSQLVASYDDCKVMPSRCHAGLSEGDNASGVPLPCTDRPGPAGQYVS